MEADTHISIILSSANTQDTLRAFFKVESSQKSIEPEAQCCRKRVKRGKRGKGKRSSKVFEKPMQIHSTVVQ